MKLTELEPEFHRYESRGESIGIQQQDGTVLGAVKATQYLVPVERLEDAQGIMFLCPVCFQKNGGNVGTHSVDVTFRDRGATDEQGSHNNEGKPSRWEVSGSGFADLTTNPSIHLAGPGCGWHGWIKNGDVT
jgi:hypothetical protein